MAPAAVPTAAPSPSLLDPRRLFLDGLRQQEVERVVVARKIAEEAEVKLLRITAELAQTVSKPPAPLPATNPFAALPLCNPYADDSWWQATTTSVTLPQPTPPPASTSAIASTSSAPPDGFVLSPDSLLMDLEEQLGP